LLNYFVFERKIFLSKNRKNILEGTKDFQNVGFFWFPKHGNGFQPRKPKTSRVIFQGVF
jgi:hypothetical protein